MKPPIYGHSHLHTKCASWTAPNGGAIPRNWVRGAVRRTTHLIYIQKVPFGRRALFRKQASASAIGRDVYWRRPGDTLLNKNETPCLITRIGPTSHMGSQCSFLSVLCMRNLSVFPWNMRWRHGRSRGETKYRLATNVVRLMKGVKCDC